MLIERPGSLLAAEAIAAGLPAGTTPSLLAAPLSAPPRMVADCRSRPEVWSGPLEISGGEPGGAVASLAWSASAFLAQSTSQQLRHTVPLIVTDIRKRAPYRNRLGAESKRLINRPVTA